MWFIKEVKNIFEKRFLVFFILLVTAMSLIGWFFNDVTDTHKKNINHVLRVEAASINKLFARKVKDSFSIVKRIGSQISKNPRNVKYVSNVLSKFKLTPELHNNLSWTNFTWCNSSYIVVANAEKGSVKNGFDLSIRDYIESTKSQPGEFHLGTPVIGSTSEKWIIPGGFGLVDKNGKYVGAVVGGFDIASLAQSLQENLMHDNIEIEITNEDGVSLLQAGAESFSVPKKEQIISESEFVEVITNMKDSNIDLVEGVSFAKDGKTYLVNKLDSLPYFLILRYKQEAITNAFWRSVRLQSVDIFVMFLVSLLLLIAAYKAERGRQKKLLRAKIVAEKAGIAKDRILFSITHDIKNYIFGLGGLGHMVLDSKSKKEILESEDLQIVETMCDQIEELKDFIEDLLDINQVDSGGFSLGALKDVDVKTMIDTVLAFSKSVAANSNVTIKRNVANNLPKLRCDSRRMKQILINIINNAVKYSKPKSDVIVSAMHLKSKKKICFEIIDKGFGMSDEDIEKYLKGQGGQIDKSDVAQIKKIDSSGLGIPIALKLINLHKGTIQVESKKDIGTKVRIYFDLAGDKIKSAAKKSKYKLPELSEGEKSTNHEKLILLVEDNPVNIKVTCRILEKQSYSVIYAENGRDALAIIEKECPDLILMDGEMPVMNGYETTRNIRKGTGFKNFTNFKKIPIIGLMSSADKKTIKKSLDAGMDTHIEKSTSSTKLLMDIRKYLDK